MSLFICQFCGRETTNAGANKKHENRCKFNPEPNHIKPKSKKWLESMKKRRPMNQYTKAKELGIPKPVYDTSLRPRKGCVSLTRDEWYELVKGKVGGYRENAGRSKKFRVKDSYGNENVLQSTYELRCSEILNELGIKWIRPKHLKYADNKKYFADFYLTDYDIYLDPKNDYKAKLDKQKIESVIKENNVIIHILTEDMINEEYITMLVSPKGEGLS